MRIKILLVLMVKIKLLSLFITFGFSATAQQAVGHDILRQELNYNDHSKASVQLSELYQGCPQLDCIESIDEPEFINGENAQHYLENEPVMVVNYNGESKAYSLKIMQKHEVVNDEFNKKPLVITYCPLCNSAVALIPKVNGRFTTFGVSGLLYNSDLVLYDRHTLSLWGQITGEAIVGERTGDKLERVYVGMINWKHAKLMYPGVKALLPPKNTQLDYDADTFSDYKSNDNILFPVSVKDARLMNKAEIIGFKVNNQAVAIDLDYLKQNRVFMEKVNGKTVNVVMKVNGRLEVKNLTDKTDIVPVWMYWFAWYNFHPDTLLIKTP